MPRDGLLRLLLVLLDDCNESIYVSVFGHPLFEEEVHILFANWKQIHKVQLVLSCEFEVTQLALNFLNERTDLPWGCESQSMGYKVLTPEVAAFLEFLRLLEECRVTPL